MDMWKNDPDSGPIFGRVSEEFRDWYLQYSGTYFADGKWHVDSSRILNENEIKVWEQSTAKNKPPKPARFFQADKFQNSMSKSREVIQKRLQTEKVDTIKELKLNFRGKERTYGGWSVDVGNDEIFSLMKYHKVKIHYTYQDFPCVVEITT